MKRTSAERFIFLNKLNAVSFPLSISELFKLIKCLTRSYLTITAILLIKMSTQVRVK